MHTLLRSAAGFLLVVASLSATPRLEAQDALTRQDRQGPVAVVLTLLAPPADGSPLRVRMVLDTHSVSLDGIALEQAVVMPMPDGAEVVPVAVEQATGGGHHRAAVLVFPAPAPSGPLRIVVRNVGGVAERVFTWDRAR